MSGNEEKIKQSFGRTSDNEEPRVTMHYANIVTLDSDVFTRGIIGPNFFDSLYSARSPPCATTLILPDSLCFKLGSMQKAEA